MTAELEKHSVDQVPELRNAGRVLLARERDSESEAMMYTLGRMLQLLGLLVVPVAIAGNLANERLNLREMLELSAIGILVFALGWLLQQAAKRR
jgi:hypothetical protein